MVEVGVLPRISSLLKGLGRQLLVVLTILLGWLVAPQLVAGTWSCADDAPVPVYPVDQMPSMVAVYLSEYLGQGPPAQGVSRADISSLARNMYDATGRQYVVVCVVGAENINTFDAFGILIASTGSTFNRFLYCGEAWDANLNLYYNRARWMEPGRGRFWSMDTYGGDNESPISLHKYLYANADPIDVRDPSGHDGDLSEEMEAQADSGIIDEAEGESDEAALAALKAPAYTVYLIMTPFPLPGHSGIFIKPMISNQGSVYEVGAPGGAGKVTQTFGSSDGVVSKTQRSWSAIQARYPFHPKIATLSNLQYLAWGLSLNLIGILDQDRAQIPIKYGMLLSFIPFTEIESCHSWALEAALAAFIISKT